MATMPFAGVVWQTMQYLIGLERLGFDVFYVEAHAVSPRHFVAHAGDDGAAGAAAFLDRVLRRFDFGDRWAFHALDSDSRCYGLGEARLHALYASSEVILNLHGGTRPRPEHVATNRLVCIATDPVQIEIELHQRAAATIRFVEAHRALFSFGENYARPGCLLPVSPRFTILPTRQPVVLDLWTGDGALEEGTLFTTIANWCQRRELRFAGETYQWSKHFEFLKVIDLPQRTTQPLELALSRCPEDDRRVLIENGWGVRDAVELSSDLDVYRRYIASSRGEFTVAKDQNVRLRSGWFSDRSATYLAAGRPVVTQDTGFGSILPTGAGLFAFSTVDQAAAAIDAIRTDYRAHRRAASEIAREHFAHDVVLRPLLAAAGVDLPLRPRRASPDSSRRVLLAAHRLPPDATGGVERYTERLAASLVEAGDVVAVVARRPGPGPLRREVETLPSGVIVHWLRGGAIRRERFLAEREEREGLLEEVLEEVEPDVVHVNHVLDLSPGLLGLAKARCAALVLTLHDYFFACQRIVLRTTGEQICAGPRGGLECARICFSAEGAAATQRWVLRTAYFRRLLDLADRIVCPSAHTAEFFARFGVASDRLRVITNGVWVESDGDAETWSSPAERGRLVLAFLGAIVPHKGLQVLLEALDQARLPAVELTTFGPIGDPERARALYARAARVPGLVFRMYGEYEPGDLPVLLQDIDGVVVPSQWPETFCLVAREALARGIPAIVSRVGALTESVTDGVNGLVFDHDRTDQLAALLQRLATEAELVPELRAGARATRVPNQAEHVAAIRATYRDAIASAVQGRTPREGALDEIAALADALESAGFGASPRTNVHTSTGKEHRSLLEPSLPVPLPAEV